MEVDVAEQRSVRLDACPAAARCPIAIVAADPTELEQRTAVALNVATVDGSLDGDELEAACTVSLDLEESWADKIDRVTVRPFQRSAICRSPSAPFRRTYRRHSDEPGRGYPSSPVVPLDRARAAAESVASPLRTKRGARVVGSEMMVR